MAVNNALVTTGILPLTINSVERFTLQAFLDGLAWNLTGGSVSLLMTDPNGVGYSFSATVQGGTAQVPWRVIGPAGTWLRAWDATDVGGTRQVTRPIVFTVISSPS